MRLWILWVEEVEEVVGEVEGRVASERSSRGYQPRSRKQTPVPGRVQMARRKWWRTSRVSSEGLS